MSESDRSDLFLGWNLGQAEDGPPSRSNQTRSWPGKPRRIMGKAEPWDETRSANRPGTDRANHAADFTLHPEDLPASRVDLFSPSPALDTALFAADPQEAPIPFPRCGEGIGGFRLVSELGRGAFGRVYLAEEAGLGNRPVALKVTRPEGDEPRLLARLQHTHIVPIHSVQDDPDTGLRLMCMPYFGGANLAQVLEATGSHLLSEATGQSLVEALDQIGRPASSLEDGPRQSSRDTQNTQPFFDERSVDSPRATSSAPFRSLLGRISWWNRSISSRPRPFDDHDPAQPARRFLRESSFVRASVWITARLAEGLEHAHSRGLLHRDLKPSNILIAADGTPMLLDFNLAAESVSPDEGDRAMLGGTLPYMAPEHLDAFNPNGNTPAEAVDERSDVYALGLILFEMIAGQHPFPEHAPGRPLLEIIRLMTEERLGPAPSPRDYNQEIPRGLDAIVRKCIDPDPDRRHARAGDLAEDLRRFLDDRTLKYTPEPSIAEQVAKFARRNPKLTGALPVALFSIALILGIGAAAWTLASHLQKVSARLKVRIFERSFLESQFSLNIANGPTKNLDRGIKLAEEAIRQAGGDSKSDRSQSWLNSLEPDEQAGMRADLAEMMLLTAGARVYQAECSKSEDQRREALGWAIDRLNQAESIDPQPSHALFDDRARYYSALGEATLARGDRARRDATLPTTGRDFYLIGTSFLRQGQPDRAEAALLKAIGLDPRRFWGWFSLGLCHYDQGRFAEAAGDFAVCTVLAPRFAWPWMNRGLALARLGRLVEARESYDRAIEADGQIAEARVNRALTSLQLGDASAAVDDLEKAIALGLRDIPIRAALGEAMARAGRKGEALVLLTRLILDEPDAVLPRMARGTILLSTDPKTAEADFRHVLSVDPKSAGANLGLARLLRLTDPKRSLTFTSRALDEEPGQLEALELRAWLRGRLGDPLAVIDVDRLIQAPTPHRLYNAACSLALLAESKPDPTMTARALELLRRALDSGYPRATLLEDPDLNSLRTSPTFQKWVEPVGVTGIKP